MIESVEVRDTMQSIYDVEEVAAILKVTPFTVREYLKSGILRGFKLGKGWRVKESDLEAFVDEQANGTGPKPTRKQK